MTSQETVDYILRSMHDWPHLWHVFRESNKDLYVRYTQKEFSIDVRCNRSYYADFNDRLTLANQGAPLQLSRRDHKRLRKAAHMLIRTKAVALLPPQLVPVSASRNNS